jgi:hypothetical protein
MQLFCMAYSLRSQQHKRIRTDTYHYLCLCSVHTGHFITAILGLLDTVPPRSRAADRPLDPRRRLSAPATSV